jgi:hypothetical protein
LRDRSHVGHQRRNHHEFFHRRSNRYLLLR